MKGKYITRPFSEDTTLASASLSSRWLKMTVSSNQYMLSVVALFPRLVLQAPSRRSTAWQSSPLSYTFIKATDVHKLGYKQVANLCWAFSACALNLSFITQGYEHVVSSRIYKVVVIEMWGFIQHKIGIKARKTQYSNSKLDDCSVIGGKAVTVIRNPFGKVPKSEHCAVVQDEKYSNEMMKGFFWLNWDTACHGSAPSH